MGYNHGKNLQSLLSGMSVTGADDWATRIFLYFERRGLALVATGAPGRVESGRFSGLIRNMIATKLGSIH